MIGKLKAMINALELRIRRSVPIKGVMLTMGGAGASDPTISTSYNVASVVRTGAGVYEVTINQNQIFGINVFDFSVVSIGFSIQPSAGSELYTVEITSGVGLVFNVLVKSLVVGGGNKLETQPYDIIAGDSVSVSLLINAGSGQSVSTLAN